MPVRGPAVEKHPFMNPSLKWRKIQMFQKETRCQNVKCWVGSGYCPMVCPVQGNEASGDTKHRECLY